MKIQTVAIQEAQIDIHTLLELVKSGVEIHLTDGDSTLARLSPEPVKEPEEPAFTLHGLEPLPEGFWCS